VVRFYRTKRHNASRPVSRVLYGLGAFSGAATWRPFIWDAHCCAPRATYPGGGPETAPRVASLCRPYSVLLPVWFAVPLPLPAARWALTPPFHPYPPSPFGLRWASPAHLCGACPPQPKGRRRAVCFLWHCHWGRPRRMLSGTVSPWSPDFPQAQPFGSRACGRPAGWRCV